MFTSAVIAYYMYQVTLPATYERERKNIEHRSSVLEVSVDSLGNASVPPGAQRVEMLRLRLKASCQFDIPVYTIGVWRRGPGFNNDIQAVYVMDGRRRLSSAHPISRRDGFVRLNLRRFTVKACETKNLTIFADFSENASIASEHRFELLRAGDIDAMGQVKIKKEIPRMTSRRSAVRRTSGTPLGKVAVSYIKLVRPVRYGSRQTLSRFRLTADSRDNHVLQAITFTNNGSAAEDQLQSLYIAGSRGERLSHIAPQMEGDHVRLVLSPPLLLKRGKTRQFRLMGNVKIGRSKTIQFVIEEPVDIEALVRRGR